MLLRSLIFFFYKSIHFKDKNEINKIRSEVFFDIKIGKKSIGRLTFELFDEIVPLTSGNFKELCRGKIPKEGFFNSKFHRVIKNFMAQGGDFTKGNGTGGRSIYGAKFKDENFNAKHSERGILSIANSGENTNGSQFFILFTPQRHLNKKHVVFGRVIDGWDVLDKIEEAGCEQYEDRSPYIDILIEDCGIIYDPKPSSKKIPGDL